MLHWCWHNRQKTMQIFCWCTWKIRIPRWNKQLWTTIMGTRALPQESSTQFWSAYKHCIQNFLWGFGWIEWKTSSYLLIGTPDALWNLSHLWAWKLWATMIQQPELHTYSQRSVWFESFFSTHVILRDITNVRRKYCNPPGGAHVLSCKEKNNIFFMIFACLPNKWIHFPVLKC